MREQVVEKKGKFGKMKRMKAPGVLGLNIRFNW